MTSVRAIFLLAAAACLAIAASSCTAVREVRVGELSSPTAARSSSVRVAGYTTTDGAYHSWEGAMRSVGDSLIFVIEHEAGHGLVREVPGQEAHLARDQVASVKLVRTDTPRTVVFSIGLLVALLAVTVAGLVAGYGS